MLEIMLAAFSIWWFCHTEYFETWSFVKIGGEQISVSLTAIIIIVYVAIGIHGAIRWHYFN